jgi:hypothetical protein
MENINEIEDRAITKNYIKDPEIKETNSLSMEEFKSSSLIMEWNIMDRLRSVVNWVMSFIR